MTTLDEALEAAWRTHRPKALPGSHRSHLSHSENPKWEPEKSQNIQKVAKSVPTVPTVPTNFDKGHGTEPENALQIDPDEWEERAAILEYEGGLNRAEAERIAAIMVRGD